MNIKAKFNELMDALIYKRDAKAIEITSALLCHYISMRTDITNKDRRDLQDLMMELAESLDTSCGPCETIGVICPTHKQLDPMVN